MSLAVAGCTLTILVFQSVARSQERWQLVETGVILNFSANEAPKIRFPPPFWTPSAEQLAQLEVRLKAHLEASPQGKEIAELGTYKRQYLGYTEGGKKWIFVNSFCEEAWKEEIPWRDQFLLSFDGGPCFHNVRYDPSTGQFDQLRINGPYRF